MLEFQMVKSKIIWRALIEFGENTSILGKFYPQFCAIRLNIIIKWYFLRPGLSNAAKAKTRTRAVVWLLIFTGFSYLTMDVLWTTITDILDYPITTTTDVSYKSEVHVFHEKEGQQVPIICCRLSFQQWQSATWTGSTVTVHLLPCITWSLLGRTHPCHRIKRLTL